MRLPQRDRGGELKFSLTPLIDVVFNLVIFFLAASHLAQSTDTEAVELPSASTSRLPEPVDSDEVTLTVIASGEYKAQGRALSDTELSEWLDRHAASAGGGPGIQLRIRSDKSAKFKHLVPVLTRCAERGISRVRFATDGVASPSRTGGS